MIDMGALTPLMLNPSGCWHAKSLPERIVPGIVNFQKPVRLGKDTVLRAFRRKYQRIIRCLVGGERLRYLVKGLLAQHIAIGLYWCVQNRYRINDHKLGATKLLERIVSVFLYGVNSSGRLVGSLGKIHITCHIDIVHRGDIGPFVSRVYKDN